MSYSDYYPFHMQMPDRFGGTYRYLGANGQESQTEITGNNSHSTAEYWMYDNRLGRRWNVDPLSMAYQSDYVTFSNNPIIKLDPNGAEVIGLDRRSARKTRKLIRKTFSNQDKQIRKLFKLKAFSTKFKEIDESHMEELLLDVKDEETRALIRGYKEVINSETKHYVGVRKRHFSFSLSKAPKSLQDQMRESVSKTKQYINGKMIDDNFAGGYTVINSEGSLSLITLNSKTVLNTYAKDKIFDGNVIVTKHPTKSSAGEILAHEVVGHSYADQLYITDAQKNYTFSIQITNLYLKTTGANYYRASHGAEHTPPKDMSTLKLIPKQLSDDPFKKD